MPPSSPRFSFVGRGKADTHRDMPLAAIQVQPDPLQPKPTLAAERSGNATHGVSQVSGELRYCNAAGMSAMQPKGRLQRLGPGCAVAMQAVSYNAFCLWVAEFHPVNACLGSGARDASCNGNAAMQLRN
eukprot:scaffold42781_cov68-Phaeocystis_antarctica.AAC.1